MKTKNKIVLCYIVMIFSALAPFIVMCAINWSEWFDFTRPQGWKVSIGFLISLIVFLLLIFKSLKCETWVYALIIGLVFYLLSGIMEDIYTMALVESIGLFIFARVNKYVTETLKPLKQMEKSASLNAQALKSVLSTSVTVEEDSELYVPPKPVEVANKTEETGW